MYSQPGPEDRIGLDYDAAGRLNIKQLESPSVSRSADFYLCGPPSFLRDLKTGLRTWNIDSTRFHSEVFGPEESITPGIVPSSRLSPHSPSGPPGPGPRISFTRSGLTVPWDSRFQSLLELAEACDVPVKWSCRTGVCHTCESALIGGSIDYQPDPLEPPAEGNLLICCSQPSSDVEIDL
jgi:ferredoxin